MPKYRYEVEIYDIEEGVVTAKNMTEAKEKIAKETQYLDTISEPEIERIPKDEESYY